MTDRAAFIQQRKQERLKRIVGDFEQQFGSAHLHLAYHAAFSLTLTPDLLYLLWANFQYDTQGAPLNIPYIAVADLLLSNLCQPVQYELYQIDPIIRNQLLSQLKADSRFGLTRLNELADFFMLYIQDQLNSDETDTRTMAKEQYWTALAYTKPGETAQQLRQAVQRCLQRSTGKVELELAQLVSIIETLADPLRDYGFEPLLVYAQGMSRQEAKEVFREDKQILNEAKLTVVGEGVPSEPFLVDNIRPEKTASDFPQNLRRIFSNDDTPLRLICSENPALYRFIYAPFAPQSSINFVDWVITKIEQYDDCSDIVEVWLETYQLELALKKHYRDKQFGDLFKQLVETHNLSNNKLGEVLEGSYKTARKWRNGYLDPEPTRPQLIDLQKVGLGVSDVNDLLGILDQPPLATEEIWYSDISIPEPITPIKVFNVPNKRSREFVGREQQLLALYNGFMGNNILK